MSVSQLLHRHGLLIILILLTMLLALIGDDATRLLRYQATEIKNGEIWRLLSGNLVHLGWPHTFMNVAGLALIWGLFWHCYNQYQWLVITLVSSLAVGVGLLLLNPQLNWYVGLSGTLHGLFIAGAIAGLRRGEYRELILLLAVTSKLLWEQLVGALPGSADIAGGPVVVDAHLYGALGGAIIALIIKPGQADKT